MIDSMQTVFVCAAVAVMVSIFLILVRTLSGPTLFDRLLAVNAMGTKTVMFIALLGFVTRRADFLDVALLYALMNFIGTLAVLKLIEMKRLG